uniref:Uncharacterized protein n=1 Tax=Candidatus Nitrotoga fabula TaxID=2182327 RepID=A0A2X0SPY8_9PROT|nr:protein of unknown function [Candidatus Nitrotoga fabula]
MNPRNKLQLLFKQKLSLISNPHSLLSILKFNPMTHPVFTH